MYVGLDLGTSGCRAVAVDATGAVAARSAAPLPPPHAHAGTVTQEPGLWWQAVIAALRQLGASLDPQRIATLSVDGTSGSLLLCDRRGTPLAPALMYNDSRAVAQAKTLAVRGFHEAATLGASSGLAKLLWLTEQGHTRKAAFVLNQADWIVGKLTGTWGVSDYNNALKLGYDAHALQWPVWIRDCGVDAALLPTVSAPGVRVARLRPRLARALGWPTAVEVVTGTTDGVAAFLAAGAARLGDAVSSLGTTLILKLLTDRPINSADHGVYSHRLGRYWLAGGASNSGGGVLLQHFSAQELRALSTRLDPDRPTGLDYYPLPDTGERFPINDPAKKPRVTPIPPDPTAFLQGLFEGIARIERDGYRLLAHLGATPLRAVYTTGGGAANPAWTRIRERVLAVEMREARSHDAAYGTALIASGIMRRMFDSQMP